MRLREFEEIIAAALDGLPPGIQALLENVTVVAAHFPTREQLQDNHMSSRYDLLGLYEGVPLTQRDSGYGMVLPDRITIFRGPIEACCVTKEEMAEEIRRTVTHELAHHFGISDERLEDMGRY
jgi:predicted Zn-dependent protease with MMP-like domain